MVGETDASDLPRSSPRGASRYLIFLEPGAWLHVGVEAEASGGGQQPSVAGPKPSPRGQTRGRQQMRIGVADAAKVVAADEQENIAMFGDDGGRPTAELVEGRTCG
jgi:hypothetical protein